MTFSRKPEVKNLVKLTIFFFSLLISATSVPIKNIFLWFSFQKFLLNATGHQKLKTKQKSTSFVGKVILKGLILNYTKLFNRHLSIAKYFRGKKYLTKFRQKSILVKNRLLNKQKYMFYLKWHIKQYSAMHCAYMYVCNMYVCKP
jgi:hypothetical protein